MVKRYGRLKVLDDRELVVEFEGREEFDGLQKDLLEVFRGQVDLELVAREGA